MGFIGLGCIQSDGEEFHMVDIDLLVQALRGAGHTVETVIPVPENAGSYELSIDGNIVPLAQARLLLESDDTRRGQHAYRKSA